MFGADLLEDSFIKVIGSGILALLILRAVFDFLEKWSKWKIPSEKHSDHNSHTNKILVEALKEALSPLVIQINEIHIMQKELYKWHDVEDPNEPGVKIWWVRVSLYKAIESLAEAVRQQTQVLTQVVSSQSDIRSAVKDLLDRQE